VSHHLDADFLKKHKISGAADGSGGGSAHAAVSTRGAPLAIPRSGLLQYPRGNLTSFLGAST